MIWKFEYLINNTITSLGWCGFSLGGYGWGYGEDHAKQIAFDIGICKVFVICYVKTIVPL